MNLLVHNAWPKRSLLPAEGLTEVVRMKLISELPLFFPLNFIFCGFCTSHKCIFFGFGYKISKHTQRGHSISVSQENTEHSYEASALNCPVHRLNASMGYGIRYGLWRPMCAINSMRIILDCILHLYTYILMLFSFRFGNVHDDGFVTQKRKKKKKTKTFRND